MIKIIDLKTSKELASFATSLPTPQVGILLKFKSDGKVYTATVDTVYFDFIELEVCVFVNYVEYTDI